MEIQEIYSKNPNIEIEHSPYGKELCVSCSQQVHYVAYLYPGFKATLKFTSMDRSVLKSITLYGNPDIVKPSYLPSGVIFKILPNITETVTE